ncbi:MAG: anaerobic carbon-monoxide dehydrogenase catalytic subunit [Candidatus Firestonebacteria bacterium]|nr:anaerobic carbon-monoxide dehydrogenase catalytic subunit [Candidatus Firestonebacteria bacterium]
MSKDERKSDQKAYDSASISMIDKACKDKVNLSWDRYASIQPQCVFGVKGVCCRFCNMGPCRLNPKTGVNNGVCGADADLITARTLTRSVAAGTAAHSNHGLEMAYTLLDVAEGKTTSYKITDEIKLRAVAKDMEIPVDGRTKEEIARDVALAAISDFEKSRTKPHFLKRIPEKRIKIWEKLGIVPRGVNEEIIEALHRTNMGMGSDYKEITLAGFRVALANGWAGCMLATEITDILFGTPKPLRSQVNLGVLKEDMVNVLIHGHEPLLSMVIVDAALDKEIKKLAEQAGAKGVNIAGICCTANEVLMRRGVPVAGNFLQQELAIVTGAVEAMVVDVQCIMPSLPEVAKCFHTKIISTSTKAVVKGAVQILFDEEHAYDRAKDILKEAINNFKNRDKSKVNIPDKKMDLVAGFSHETINYMQGGTFKGSYYPLVENIKNGRIRGVVGIVGCNNPRFTADAPTVELIKILIKNNILVVQTGCAAIAAAKEGLMVPEAKDLAGDGLREVCEAVGCPPVLHCGSCVDNSRILIACTEMIKHGLAEDYGDLPVAGVAIEWMSEKALSIGNYFVAQGAMVLIGVQHQVTGSENMTNLLYNEIEGMTGGKFVFEPDPHKAAEIIIEHINKKRKVLGI